MVASASSTIWLKVIDTYKTKNHYFNNNLITISYSFIIIGLISFFYLLLNRLNQKKETIIKLYLEWSQIVMAIILTF